MNTPLCIAMLISGGGTTMRAILDACKDGQLSGLVEPAVIISSCADAGGIKKALDWGLPKDKIFVLNPSMFKVKGRPIEAFGQKIIDICREHGVNFIGQYGWLKLTPPNVIQAFPDMIVNQHPGPLDTGHPDFGGSGMYGRRVHHARLYFVRYSKYGAQMWTEATAHRATEHYDKGAVLYRRQVEITSKDDVISLQQRVLPVEHRVQIETLRQFATGEVKESPRLGRLIAPDEAEVLERAKQEAILMWPNG